jgi:hypothetical protein
MTKKKRYKRYSHSPEFKREALKRTAEEGIPEKQVCDELGISARQLSRWRDETMGLYVGVGAALGIGVGTGLGAAFGNVAIGMSLGPAFGLALGLAVWSFRSGSHARK